MIKKKYAINLHNAENVKAEIKDAINLTADLKKMIYEFGYHCNMASNCLSEILDTFGKLEKKEIDFNFHLSEKEGDESE